MLRRHLVIIDVVQQSLRELAGVDVALGVAESQSGVVHVGDGLMRVGSE